FRLREDQVMERERSMIIDSLLDALADDGITLPVISRQLNIPVGELSNLLFRFGLIQSI
ncbi:DNA-binding protein, partial [Klebsiella pneumoniae]